MAIQILLVEDDAFQSSLIAESLRKAGYSVTVAVDGVEALFRIDEVVPDLIISDIIMPRMDGRVLIERLRSDPQLQVVPFIFLTSEDTLDKVIEGLELGADDYLTKPVERRELLARVRSKTLRPPVPRERLPFDRQTQFLTEQHFLHEVEQEHDRVRRGGQSGCLARLELHELDAFEDRIGERSLAQIMKQVALLVGTNPRPLEVAGRNPDGSIELLFPETTVETAQQRLQGLMNHIVIHQFIAGAERLQFTPVVGFTSLDDAKSVDEARNQVLAATHFARTQLDLTPVRYRPGMGLLARKVTGNWLARLRAWLNAHEEGGRLTGQIVVVAVLGFVLPFFFYVLAPVVIGIDVAPIMYIVIVVSLLMTALTIWVEGFRALRRIDPPEFEGDAYPSAVAVIVAYLPSEAPTIVSTIEAFLRVEYRGLYEVLLVYNTPRDLPIEMVLSDIAARDPRFRAVRVEHSTSKAQNINAALSEINGAEIVGIFDADHQPTPGAFTRAWHWLAAGYDVVQGHCLVRNGDETWVSRMVAVEFESIYAVSHPGRARLHDFGIFGGSNGYWKADLLRQTRMHGFMLTEDIDSSMRAIEEGYRIVSDPLLISRELAPVNLRALWNQRMRWAQGWFQVSITHLWRSLRSRRLTWRQKLGAFYLLGWREVYPWISIQMFPIVVYWSWKSGGPQNLNWFVPVFVLTTLFTLGTGPVQAMFAYRLADPEIRQRRSWFFHYLLTASLLYPMYKNLISVVAQVKEVTGERAWKVTPRGKLTEKPPLATQDEHAR